MLSNPRTGPTLAIDFASASAMLIPDRGEAGQTAPTYNKSNAFTAVFQELVDTYGVPRYREANPALLTVVTFPFLFGVMYGDVGHGLMLLVGAFWIFWSDAARCMPDLCKARYLILLMGLFSVYCGSFAAFRYVNSWCSSAFALACVGIEVSVHTALRSLRSEAEALKHGWPKFQNPSQIA